MTRAGGLLQPDEHFKCNVEWLVMSAAPKQEGAAVGPAPQTISRASALVLAERTSSPERPDFFTALKRVKLMEPRTQKISGEMNCTTKARSICTDKSMKNGAGKCSACTAEQVNCPFCLLWGSNFSQMQPYVFGGWGGIQTNKQTVKICQLCGGKR